MRTDRLQTHPPPRKSELIWHQSGRPAHPYNVHWPTPWYSEASAHCSGIPFLRYRLHRRIPQSPPRGLHPFRDCSRKCLLQIRVTVISQPFAEPDDGSIAAV